MGRIQELRRTVRIELVAYAERHPDDFDAHMTASAAMWLLAGRQGLTQPQQLALLRQAEEAVARLGVGRRSRTLVQIQQQLHELVDILTRRMRVQQDDSEFIALFAEDFAQWAEELTGGGERGDDAV
jgi:hypothetical protein